MKILVLADEEYPAFWENYTPGRLKEYDLILSCGDLNSRYLSFIVTMAKAPVLYIHGNHDEGYLRNPPDGCDCIDDDLVIFRGLRILGLGGCLRYRPGTFQYSEKDMRKRIRKLWFKLWRNRGVDIVVTHAPPQGVGDGDDRAHRGFACFLPFLNKYQPKYLFHGHTHLRYGNVNTRIQHYGATQVINACGHYVLEIPDDTLPKTKKKGIYDCYV